jgi:isopentenyl-diphosphate delta-isomerase
MNDETVQTYDANGMLAALVQRSRVHREGLWHRATSVFLFRSDGRLLVQRRSAHKDICPGLWDLSVAEHLQPGESYEQGAVRGLREELGVGQVVLEAIGGVARARIEIPERGVKDYELQQSFRGVFDGELRPDANEVAELATISLGELELAFRDKPDDFTSWFRETARRLSFVERQ